MGQEFDAGEWIADGVLAALGEDPEMSAQGEHILLYCSLFLHYYQSLILRVDRSERRYEPPRGP
jgi:hypothetical protein